MELEKEEPNIQDVLDAVHVFASNMEERFDKVGKRFDSLEKNLRLEIGTARDKAFSHADNKAMDAIIESGKKINQHKEQDKTFKQKLISVMKKHDVASAQELKGLAQAI